MTIGDCFVIQKELATEGSRSEPVWLIAARFTSIALSKSWTFRAVGLRAGDSDPLPDRDPSGRRGSHQDDMPRFVGKSCAAPFFVAGFARIQADESPRANSPEVWRLQLRRFRINRQDVDLSLIHI